MKVQITANGNTIDAELTAEQAEKLGLTEKKKTGWERVKERNAYCLVDAFFDIVINEETNENIDDILFRSGNYFADRALAEKMSKRIGLMMRMQRWADEHNDGIDWRDSRQPKFYICGDCENELEVDCIFSLDIIGTVYFSTKKLAEQAIEIFGDEIIKAYIKE